MSVKAIPEGFTAVTPYFNIKGAREAIAFYKKAFGAEEHAAMNGPDGTLMHAELSIAGARFMLSEAARNAPTASSTHLYLNNAQAVWDRAVKAGAKIEMPIMVQPWGDLYGVVSDGFGN